MADVQSEEDGVDIYFLQKALFPFCSFKRSTAGNRARSSCIPGSWRSFHHSIGLHLPMSRPISLLLPEVEPKKAGNVPDLSRE